MIFPIIFPIVLPRLASFASLSCLLMSACVFCCKSEYSDNDIFSYFRTAFQRSKKPIKEGIPIKTPNKRKIYDHHPNAVNTSRVPF